MSVVLTLFCSLYLYRISCVGVASGALPGVYQIYRFVLDTDGDKVLIYVSAATPDNLYATAKWQTQ